MAVVLTSCEGFVLDHEQAIMSAYSQCNFLSAFSSPPQRITTDVSNLYSENAPQCLGSATTSQQSSNVDGSSECGITVIKHSTAALKDDAPLIESNDPDSEFISVPQHFVQSVVNINALEPSVSFSKVKTQCCDENKPSFADAGLTLTFTCASSDTGTSSVERCVSLNSLCKSHTVTSFSKKTSQVPVSRNEKEPPDQEAICRTDFSLGVSTRNDTVQRHKRKYTCEFMTDNTVDVRVNLSCQSQCDANQSTNGYQVTTPDSNKQTRKIVNSCSLTSELANERVSSTCPADPQRGKITECKIIKDGQKMETGCEISTFSKTDTDCLQSAALCSPKVKKLSLRLKQGFFAVKVPFMMDSQFEKVKRYFMQEKDIDGEGRKQIGVADIQQVLQSKHRKRKHEKIARSIEEEMLDGVHTSLTHLARDQGIFLKHISQPLDNNLLSRQCAQLDRLADVFTSLLVTADGAPLLHMGDCFRPLEISGCDSLSFSAAEIIHRRVSHQNTEASVVDIDGTSFVFPPRSEFLVSNLQDFCDHLYIEFVEDGFDLLVLDPPWENKSVKRKKSYDMMNEDDLQKLPMTSLARPGCLVALWVTNNERLEDYCQHTLFPLWGLTSVARWYWLKVTQTGDMISDMDGHKKPYEILLLGRASGADSAVQEEREEPPERKVMMSVPCSLHSKKPPLADVLQPYLPTKPRCLELFARNLWPRWTSWGREVLKHQNLMFYEVTDSADGRPTIQQET